MAEQAANAAAELNAKRKQLLRKESAKREDKGHAQTFKLTYWSVRIKLPETVAEDCWEKYKEAGDDAREYWVRSAYRFVDREDELEAGPGAVQENGSSDE